MRFFNRFWKILFKYIILWFVFKLFLKIFCDISKFLDSLILDFLFFLFLLVTFCACTIALLLILSCFFGFFCFLLISFFCWLFWLLLFDNFSWRLSYFFCIWLNNLFWVEIFYFCELNNLYSTNFKGKTDFETCFIDIFNTIK